VFGWDIEIFGGGSLTVPRLQLGPISTDGDRAQLVLLAAVFSLFAMVVVALRRGRMGRRLLALRDSPAACATFGIDLTVTKLGVFALSAGMAGVGGALFGGLVQSVTTDTFGFVQGLPVLMMTVVGGIGAVSGALFGGVALGGIEVLAGAVPGLRTVLALTPGLVGIGLARNPNGVVSDVAAGVERFRARPVRGGRGAHAAERDAASTRPAPRLAELDRRVPLGYVGVDRPFTADDRDLLDALLGLNEADLDAAARR
jgi:branched-chain amino acid transport system permease protein